MKTLQIAFLLLCYFCGQLQAVDVKFSLGAESYKELDSNIAGAFALDIFKEEENDQRIGIGVQHRQHEALQLTEVYFILGGGDGEYVDAQFGLGYQHSRRIAGEELHSLASDDLTQQSGFGYIGLSAQRKSGVDCFTIYTTMARHMRMGIKGNVLAIWDIADRELQVGYQYITLDMDINVANTTDLSGWTLSYTATF